MEADEPGPHDNRGPLMVEACQRIDERFAQFAEFLDGASKIVHDLRTEFSEMRKIWETPSFDVTAESDSESKEPPDDEDDNSLPEAL